MAEKGTDECGDTFTYTHMGDRIESKTDYCNRPAGHADDLHHGASAQWRHVDRDGEKFDTYVQTNRWGK